ncbi:type III-A CRISPR-associated RAMP protein Csm5 [Palaeococcus sp. (in: euryarchaeotes)]
MMLTILSPLHIGNGEELTPADVYPGEEVLHVIDTEKLLNDLVAMGADLDEIVYYLKNPSGSTYIWKHYMDKYHLNPGNYALYSLRIHGGIGKRSSQIKTFIKLNGKPYVPGSSIKGAIRTAVLYKVLKECGSTTKVSNMLLGASENLRNLASRISDPRNSDVIDYYLFFIRSTKQRQKIDTKNADELLEALVFGFEGTSRYPNITYEPKKDPMRALLVRDSAPFGFKHLSLYRVDVIGNPQPIPIWLEALDEEASTEIEIKVNEEELKLGKNYFNGLLWECLKEQNPQRPWESFEEFVWDAVDEFYHALIEAELKGSYKFKSHKKEVEAFYTSLKRFNGHLMRLGWGTGWVGMTIGMILMEKGWKWENVRRELGLGRKPRGREFSKDFPKTKRLVNGKPMGWVVLR